MEEQPEEEIFSALPDPPKYLVTGGCGFVGRKIVEALRKGGQRVLVLDHKPYPEIPAWPASGLVDYMQADIRDNSLVNRAMKGIEVVFHTARASDPNGDYKTLHSVNVTGTEAVIEAARQHEVRGLVYTSSVSVVVDGNDIHGGDETMPYATSHLDHAATTKCLAEKTVLEANGQLWNGHQLWTCALRPEMIFGPGDNHFVPQILDKAREGEMTHMIGDGSNVVDFTYIDNVILAHVLASEHLYKDSPVCGQAYFITNGEVMPFWEFLRQVLGGMGFPSPTKAIGTKLAYGTAFALEKVGGLLNYFVRFKPKLTRQLVFNMSRNHYFQHTKAAQDFGYKPVVTLEEGIKRTLDFYRTNQAVRMDFRVFEIWANCRASLWPDAHPVDMIASRGGSSASIHSLDSLDHDWRADDSDGAAGVLRNLPTLPSPNSRRMSKNTTRLSFNSLAEALDEFSAAAEDEAVEYSGAPVSNWNALGRVSPSTALSCLTIPEVPETDTHLLMGSSKSLRARAPNHRWQDSPSTAAAQLGSSCPTEQYMLPTDGS
jgi:sterol-4alpha-carboxylate 3-dehydrogenase (decarboxylating)